MKGICACKKMARHDRLSENASGALAWTSGCCQFRYNGNVIIMCPCCFHCELAVFHSHILLPSGPAWRLQFSLQPHRVPRLYRLSFVTLLLRTRYSMERLELLVKLNKVSSYKLIKLPPPLNAPHSKAKNVAEIIILNVRSSPLYLRHGKLDCL